MPKEGKKGHEDPKRCHESPEKRKAPLQRRNRHPETLGEDETPLPLTLPRREGS